MSWLGAESWEREKSKKLDKNYIYPIVSDQGKRELFPNSFQKLFLSSYAKMTFFSFLFF